MRTRDFHRWVVLRLRFYEGHLWIAYEDEIGTRRSVPRYRAGEPIPAG
jgi:hypothetical protein